MKYTIIDGELYHTDELYHHGIKGMRWGVRRKLKNKSNSDIRKDMKRKKLENEYAQTLAANKEVDRQRRFQEKQTRFKERAQAKNARAQAKLERINNRTAIMDAKKKQADIEKLLRAANVKLSKWDQKKVDEMNRQKQITDAEANKLKSDKALKDARKENWSPIRKAVDKILSKFGNAALDGAAEAGKTLLRDKLISFGKDKLGLNTIDPDAELKKEASRATWKNTIRLNDKKRYKELFGDDEPQTETPNKAETKTETPNKEETKTKEPNNESPRRGGGVKGMKWGVRQKQEQSQPALPTSERLDKYSGRTREEMIKAVREANEKTAAESRKRNENFNSASYNPQPATIKKTEVLLLTANPNKKKKKK